MRDARSTLVDRASSYVCARTCGRVSPSTSPARDLERSVHSAPCRPLSPSRRRRAGTVARPSGTSVDRAAVLLHADQRVLEPGHGGLPRGERARGDRLPAAAAVPRRRADRGVGQVSDGLARPFLKLAADGAPLVWLGANFWSRSGGPLMWRSYDPTLVREELAVLHEHGLTMTRSFFYWPDFMPDPDLVDESLVEHFADFLD